MPFRIKRSRTKAVILRKPKGAAVDKSKNIREADDLTKHEHDLPSIPSKLQQRLRKPLRTFYASQRLRQRNRRQERDLLRAIGQRLETHANSFLGTKIHPVAVLAWLAAEESFSIEFLLDNASLLIDDDDSYQTVDPVFIAEIDSLIEKFTNSCIDNAPSSQDNRLLKVPKDFSMVQSPSAIEGGKDYDTIMEDLEKLDQTWSIRGVEHSFSKKQDDKYGFDPVQVLKKHAIQFQDPDCPKESTLSNDIHPIFREENFHGCPQHIYDSLKPGLRLATLLLTHKSTSTFWHTLKFGQRRLCFRNHAWDPVISDAVTWNEDVADQWSTYLKDVASNIHVTFSLWPTEKDHGVWAYGTMHPIRDYKTGFTANGTYRNSRLNMHTDFYTTAKRLSLLKSPDPAMVLRFHFFLAVNLCHEFAHFVEASDPSRVEINEDAFGGVAITSEAYIFDYTWQEMGWAFEKAVFGGMVQPISCRTDCMYGLATYDLANTRGKDHALRFNCKMRTFWTVPMTFVSKLQQMESWDKADGDDNGRWLMIPRDGATAVTVPYFDMTVWKDEAEDPISDEKDGRTTPFMRTKEGRIEKRQKSPPRDAAKLDAILKNARESSVLRDDEDDDS